MSVEAEESSVAGFDVSENQLAYVFAPALENTPERPTKRMRIAKSTKVTEEQNDGYSFQFESLLNGKENAECVNMRQELFHEDWAATEERIQCILGEANEKTLAEVTLFVQDVLVTEDTVPAGLIVTGPNIASQDLLFDQLSKRLQAEVNGPTITLRSGDASNLKSVLKHLIRDATNQGSTDEDEEEVSYKQDGRKLFNYDLEILHGYVKTHGTKKVTVSFQDSEAFDSVLLAELISLFRSWVDRIPFVLLFGIATSVELFHERISRAASRCLHGVQFDVEQTSLILQRVFLATVAGCDAPLRLGPVLIASLMERQHDHVQSVQAFTAALKHAYMCHFYANPLSILIGSTALNQTAIRQELLQPEHYEAIRMLPSFRKLIDTCADRYRADHAKELLEDDEILFAQVKWALQQRSHDEIGLLQRLHILCISKSVPMNVVDLYFRAFQGTLSDSDIVQEVLDSVKRMTPEGVIAFITKIESAVKTGSPGMNLDDWFGKEGCPIEVAFGPIREEAFALMKRSTKIGNPIRNTYALHSKGIRTTVVAQKVQLSYEQSSLSKEDIEFTALVDRFYKALQEYFTFGIPQDLFMSEVWLYDSISPYRDVFTPRPRFAIERALSAPQDYLDSCDVYGEAFSTNKPATAILYQMYLESGTLVNIFDLWTAFISIVGSEDGEGYDERTALMLFYRGLADLKLLGMIKQSKKKADHIAKSAWKGL